MAVKATLKGKKGKSSFRGDLAAVFAVWQDEDGITNAEAQISGGGNLDIMDAFGKAIGRVIKEIDEMNRLHGRTVKEGIEEALKTEDEKESGDD